MKACLVSVAVLAALVTACEEYTECKAKHHLDKLNKISAEWANKEALGEWAYTSNITDDNLKKKLDIAIQHADVTKTLWAETIKYPWRTFKDPDLKRKFKKYSLLGMEALPEEKYKKFTETVAEMEAIYSEAKICDFKNKTKCDLSLEPELTEIFRSSRDPEELKYIWTEFRSNTGRKCKYLYKEYVKLANEGAQLNNVSDYAEYWKSSYESCTFEADIEELWKQIEPLYKELHAYVRMKLNEKYGDEVVRKDGPIPAHLLGNMWAQTWSNIYDLLVPYPKKKRVDVTKKMVEQVLVDGKIVGS